MARRLYMIMLLRDNNNAKVWASMPGQMKGKKGGEKKRQQILTTITSSTTLVTLLEKPPYFQTDPDRAQAQTPFREQERIAATEAIHAGEITLHPSLFHENGDHRRQVSDKQHLGGWNVIASDDQKSSRHDQNLVFFEMIGRYLGASVVDQDLLERTGQEVHTMINEIGLIGDPEYVLAVRKAAYLFPDKYKHFFLVWPPFHSCMHGMELWKDDPIVLLSLWFPLCRYLDYKLSTFGVGAIMDQRLNAILKEVDFDRTLTVYPHNQRASTMHVDAANDSDSDDEEEPVQEDDSNHENDQARTSASRWAGMDAPVTEASIGAAMDALRDELAASGATRSVIPMDVDGGSDHSRLDSLKWNGRISLSQQLAVFCEGKGRKLFEFEEFVQKRTLAQQQNETGYAKKYSTFKGSPEVIKHSQQVCHDKFIHSQFISFILLITSFLCDDE